MSRARRLLEEDVTSIPALIQRKAHAADALRFRDQVRDLTNWKTVDLLPRLETTVDPLMLWALHLELNKRDIPPCMRFPPHQLGSQGDYIDLAADMIWLMGRYPYHQAKYRGWHKVLRTPMTSREWHEHVFRQFLFTYPRGLAHLASKGLALTEKQRSELLSVPTKRMARDREGLEGRRFEHLINTIYQYAISHPDKSGMRLPTEIAHRRARIYRIYVLSARSPTLATQYWMRLSGEILSRQAFLAQVRLVEKCIQVKTM